MKKVLHVSAGGLGNGGVSSVIFSIVEKLYKEYTFDCVVFKKKGIREEEFLKYGKLFRINAYNDNGKRNIFEIIIRPIRLYMGIYKICKSNKYDVIHCHNEYEEGICLLAAKHAGVPIRIAHSHNAKFNQKGFMKCRESLNYRLMTCAATEMVGCSQAACDYFFGKAKTKVILNSIDMNKYDISKCVSHEKLTFINVGRYTYQKNQEMAIRVFEKINEKIPNSKLLLVGYGINKEMLEREIRDRSLEKVVHMVDGCNADIPNLYATSDYMIFPSRHEGFGIVLIEAQAMGIQCFVSDAIQTEADAGLLTYIDLDDGDDIWAETILKQVREGKKRITDLDERLSKYDMSVIGREYAEIYG